MKKIDDLLRVSEDLDFSDMQSSGNNDLTISIVHCSNGKRIKLSKKLVKELGIINEVSILPIPDENCILIAKKLENAADCKLSEKDHQTVYNSKLTAYITEKFQLNMNGKTSKSFADIDVQNYEDINVAIVNIPVLQGGVK